MESWCYFSGDKEYVCENSGFASIENGRKNVGLMGWGLGPSVSLENSMECSKQELVELGSPQMMSKFIPKEKEKGLSYPVRVPSQPSSLVVDSNNGTDSSLIDLKLGRSDQRETLSLNSSISYRVAKRARPGRWSSQMPYCQVHGCRKDLSSCKDYHKRHKVCEVHSKTAKVIVNGIEQRFCQQCSRFHILAEFDNGKRSCRRRLAGHNERRRKSHVVMNSSRVGRSQDYNASRFQGTTSTSPAVWQNRVTSKLQHQQKYKADDWNKAVTSEQVHSKLDFPCHVGENSTLKRSKIDEINELSMQDDIMCSAIGSSSLLHNSSLISKYSTFLDSSSNFHEELPGMPNFGGALSLLSSLSHDSTNIPSSRAALMARSDGDASYDLGQVSQKLSEVRPQASTNGISRLTHSSFDNYLQPFSSLSCTIYGDSPMNQGTHSTHSYEGDPTINLLEFSSQFLRVDQQKQSIQVKLKHNASRGQRMT